MHRTGPQCCNEPVCFHFVAATAVLSMKSMLFWMVSIQWSLSSCHSATSKKRPPPMPSRATDSIWNHSGRLCTP